jgi:hypothetical protein
MAEAIQNQKWLFSPSVDLSVFLGSAVLSLLLLLVGAQTGILNSETPDWMWISAVLFIDVAHVWATSFRVYFDAEELKRRPFLYALVPVCGYLIGVALYSEGAITFWRILAYIAVFHFVRQQYGWVALYRAKLGERDRASYWIDTVTIYLATIYPLTFWMTALPRNFEWFVQNDFINIPNFIAQVLFPVYVLSLVVYFAKSIYLYFARGFLNPGKDIIIATTAVCWYVGIVAFNSDYAFTVTNVIIHGVPYFALVYWYSQQRRETATSFYKTLSSNWLVFLATLWLLAYTEELFWARGVWHERMWVFGAAENGGWDWSKISVFIVPLLALPQFTHYMLDGFLWKRKYNEKYKLI